MYKKHGNELISEETIELNRRDKKILCLKAISNAYQANDKDFIKNNLNTILDMMIKTKFSFNFFDIKLLIDNKNWTKDEMSQYEFILENYYNVLHTYSELASHLNITNPLDLCIYITYLLWNGYFSVTGEHAYQELDNTSIRGLQALDVMTGKGVCLNYADLLNDFLHMKGINSSIILCKFPRKKEEYKIQYKPQIKKHGNRNEEKQIIKPVHNFIEKQIGNHAVNLIRDGEKMYIFDITNTALLRILDKGYANIINGYGNFELKMLSSMNLLSDCDYDNLFEQIILEQEIDESYTKKEYKSSCKKIVELLNNNREILLESYNFIYADLKVISDTINKRNKQKIK